MDFLENSVVVNLDNRLALVYASRSTCESSWFTKIKKMFTFSSRHIYMAVQVGPIFYDVQRESPRAACSVPAIVRITARAPS